MNRHEDILLLATDNSVDKLLVPLWLSVSFVVNMWLLQHAQIEKQLIQWKLLNFSASPHAPAGTRGLWEMMGLKVSD